MTTIVAHKDFKNKCIWMGSDNARSNSHSIYSDVKSKLIKRGPYLLGISGLTRGSNLLQANFDVNDIPSPKWKDKFKHIVTDVIPYIKKIMAEGDFLPDKKPHDTEVSFILAYKDSIFELATDLSIIETGLDFAATGSGYSYAEGCLKALEKSKLDPVKKLRKSLEIAAYFDPFTRGPFSFEKLDF